MALIGAVAFDFGHTPMAAGTGNHFLLALMTFAGALFSQPLTPQLRLLPIPALSASCCADSSACVQSPLASHHSRGEGVRESGWRLGRGD